MFENIRLSIKSIWSHKMRSVLTMLGIIIGISSIIMIVSLIQATSAQLSGSMIGGGKNAVTVSLYSKNDMYSPYNSLLNGKIEGISDIPEESIEEIKMLDGVEDAVTMYYIDGGVDITYNGQSTTNRTYGVEKSFFSINELNLKSGRLFTDKDYENKHNVMVISSSLQSELFGGEDAIGKTVNLASELFVIVGVVEEFVDYDSIDSYMDYMSTAYSFNEIYIPSTSWSLVAGYDDNQSVLIKLEKAEDSVVISTQTAEILNRTLTSDMYEYKSGTLAEDAETNQTITDVISILLVGIASISLLVGGIGVMNIMLVSVTERTREIGLKKALGAKKRVILSQFLTEAIVLTSLGGIIGVLLGIVFSFLIGLITQMAMSISVPAIVISVVFSMSVGIIFGLVPSVKASKLDPIDALRYE